MKALKLTSNGVIRRHTRNMSKRFVHFTGIAFHLILDSNLFIIHIAAGSGHRISLQTRLSFPAKSRIEYVLGISFVPGYRLIL